MATLSLDLETGAVMDALAGIRDRADDPTILMRDWLLLGIRTIGLNFQAQGRPQRWDDLAESTIRRRFARASKGKRAMAMGSLGVLGSMQILRVTGQLAQSFGEGANGPFSAFGGHGESARNTMTIATSNPGAYNQFPNPRTGAPARVMAMWQESDAEDVLGMGADFLLSRGPYAL